METARLVLDYLKLFFSAPVIVGLLIFFFFRKFLPELRALINRIARITFPGGGEITTSQVERTQEASPAKNEPPPKPVGEPALPEAVNLDLAQQQQLREVFEAERARAALWEYRYLNFFLARISQVFLDWLATLASPPTIGLADAFWQTSVPVDEREAVLEALRSHHLVEIKNGQIVLTPKGREYLQWRGPLPAIEPK
jgi:hypothetical protein